MKQSEEYIHLFNRLLEGNCSPEDTALLVAWLGQETPDPLALSLIRVQLEDVPDPADIDPAIKEMLASRLPYILGDTPVVPIRSRQRWYAVAAAVALLLCIAGTYRWLTPRGNAPVAIVNDVPPGGNKAVLILADGSVVTLDSSRKSSIQQGGTSILQQNGQLQYTANTTTEVSYNTLTTPHGGQFRIVLPDGSKVWLNAVSSLHYPTVFNGKERVVELKGQAYFEIAPNSQQPFKVRVKDMEVQVLGTHFDVMAYEDELAANITLLAGSVKVAANRQSALLQPGQQAVVNTPTNTFRIQPVDVNGVVAWKNGFFQLEKSGIAAVMRQIQRWYDVEIIYENGIPDAHLSGELPRDFTLKEVLKVLELSGVKCRLENKKIYITNES